MKKTITKPKPKMYTQAEVNRMVRQAKKDGASLTPKPKAQAKMKKKVAEQKMDKNMKAGVRRARGKM